MSWQNCVFVVLLWPLIGLQNHLHSISTHILRTSQRFPARCRRPPCCSSPWPTCSGHEKILTHEWELSLFTDIILISTPYLPCKQQVVTSNTGPILVLIQPFGSDVSSFLGNVYSRQATESVNCKNSSVSFVMKCCPTWTTVRNPASVQNLLNLSCCDNFSIRSPYLCNSNCAKNSCNRLQVGTIMDRQFSTAFAFEHSSGQRARGSKYWVNLSNQLNLRLLTKCVHDRPVNLWIVRILQCPSSWKYCSISIVIRNPASVQNLLHLFYCDNFSIRYLYFCNFIFFMYRIIGQRYVCLRHTWHERGTRLSFHNAPPLPSVPSCQDSSSHISATADNFLPSLLLSNTPLDNGLVTRKTGYPLSPNVNIIISVILCHSSCGLSSLIEQLFFSDSGPKNYHFPASNLFPWRTTNWAFDSHSFWLSLDHHNLLNIDMKMIRPVNSSGWSLIFDMNSWVLWQSCNVVNPGKMFHSNSIDSPSSLYKFLCSGELLNHVNLSLHAMIDWGFSFIFPNLRIGRPLWLIHHKSKTNTSMKSLPN